MKIVIFGDSHNNIANINHVMGFAKKIKAGAVIHTGDWCDVKTVNVALEYDIPLYSVIGNGDISEEMKVKFEEKIEIEVDGLKIGVVHGPRELKKYFSNKKLDVIFYGHIHSQSEGDFNGIRIIRPGALENGINFAVFDTKTKMVEFVNHDKI